MKKDSMLGGLVFLKSIGVKVDAFTTSGTIAEGTGINHRRVREAIRKHQKAFESFGVLGAYQTETTENQTGGRKATGYLLNEQQAVFLLTLLKNTPVVVEFKRCLVRGENERMHGHAYNAYTNLIYKAATGKTAMQLRKKRGVDHHADVVPLLTADELARVTKREAQVTTLLDCGMTYDAIRAVLLGGLSHVHTA